MTLDEKTAGLAHCRAVLLRVIDKLEIDDLDYLIFPDSKSIGEVILHVVGFEYLIVSSAKFSVGQAPNYDVWRKLKPGFAREAGFEPPRRRTLDDYIGLLSDIREETLGFLSRDPNNCFINAEKSAVKQLASMLRTKYPEDDETQYRRLEAGVGTSLRDDGVVNSENCVDIFRLLQLHETYHRGQITFQKYVKSRILRRQLSS